MKRQVTRQCDPAGTSRLALVNSLTGGKGNFFFLSMDFWIMRSSIVGKPSMILTLPYDLI